MTQPLVSVLTPVYNARRYIGEVLAAVQAQTYERIEHIVVDDGSTDSSASVIEQCLKAGNRSVTFVRQPNAGEAAAVNRAFAMSSGEYVVVVNADDPPYPELIAEAVKVLQDSPDIVVAYPDWTMIDSDGRTLREINVLEYSQQALIGDYVCLPGPGAVIRAGSVPDGRLRDPSYRFVSDYELWLRMSLAGEMRRIPRTLARWRRHSNSATALGQGRLLAEEYIRVIDDFLSRDDLPPNVRRWERQARAMVLYHASAQSLFDRSVPGRRLLARSLLTTFRRRARYQTKRRSPIVVAAICATPFSSTLVRRFR